MDPNLLGFALIIVLVVGFVLTVRRQSVQRLRELMNANAQASSAQPGREAVSERQALAQPEMVQFDVLRQFPGATEARERFVQLAAGLFRRWLATEAAAALAYAVLPLAGGIFFGVDPEDPSQIFVGCILRVERAATA